MYFSQYKLPFLFFAFRLVSLVFGQPHNNCTQNFSNEIQKRNITQHCHMKQRLGAEFGWNFNNDTRRLDIVFGARLDTTPGWLAWGLNLHDVGMVGTRALIGIKHENESLSYNKYNITEATKRGCQLVPSDDIGLEVQNFSFDYLEAINYYLLQATIFLPYAYNSSRTNIVCQIGKAVLNDNPRMHPITLAHLDAGEALDLETSQPVDYSNHQREILRWAHGIINIVGWGTLLPIGLIVARYFREFPFKSRRWYDCHVIIQSTGYAAGLIGWAMGLWIGNGTKQYSFGTHRTLGIIIVTVATMQVLAFIFKPSESGKNQKDKNRKHENGKSENQKDENGKGENRKYWNMYHHSLGYILLVLIWVNIYQGLKIMEPDYVLKWAYIGVLGVLGCVVLALECVTWFKHHIKKDKSQQQQENKGSQDHIKKAETGDPLSQQQQGNKESQGHIKKAETGDPQPLLQA